MDILHATFTSFKGFSCQRQKLSATVPYYTSVVIRGRCMMQCVLMLDGLHTGIKFLLYDVLHKVVVLVKNKIHCLKIVFALNSTRTYERTAGENCFAGHSLFILITV